MTEEYTPSPSAQVILDVAEMMGGRKPVRISVFADSHGRKIHIWELENQTQILLYEVNRRFIKAKQESRNNVAKDMAIRFLSSREVEQIPDAAHC